MTDRERDAAHAELERAREQARMAYRQRDLLRRGHLTTRVAEIEAAIADPGAILPRRGETETASSWCARAVVALLDGAHPQTPADDAWAAPDRYSLAAAREEGYEPDPDPDYGKDLDDEDDPTLAHAR